MGLLGDGDPPSRHASDRAVVLTAVKDTPAVAPRAILDGPCARRPFYRAAGTRERAPPGPNKRIRVEAKREGGAQSSSRGWGPSNFRVPFPHAVEHAGSGTGKSATEERRFSWS